MAVPRNRLSNARKNSKRAHHAKKPQHLAVCKECGEKRRSHAICSGCGSYAERKVIAVKE